MRKGIGFIGCAILAGCGGAGPQTVGSLAPAGTASSSHSFVTPTEKKTYQGIGGVHRYAYSTDERGGSVVADPNAGGPQYNQLYAGNASTARNSGITIAYDPRDAIFELTIKDSAAGVDKTLRFQDPAHRTDFGGSVEPQGGTPNLNTSGIRYLQAGSGTGALAFDAAQSTTFPIGMSPSSYDVSTFFYQKPGTSTRYVTFAGFIRNAGTVEQVSLTDGSTYLQQNYTLERGAFAYGERTSNSAVPRSGTGTYSGAMVATMVYNPAIDTNSSAPTYFQWIEGTNTTSINFASGAVGTTLSGIVKAPTYDVYTTRNTGVAAGATFSATGTGQIDLVNTGGIVGSFSAAAITSGGTTTPVVIEGSSLDAAFFGPGGSPDKVEVGGGFRIVGGNPDERIDILGTFTGARTGN